MKQKKKGNIMASRFKKEIQSKRIERWVKSVRDDLYSLEDSEYHKWVETQKTKHKTLFKIKEGQQ